jgi:hypothetical protein
MRMIRRSRREYDHINEQCQRRLGLWAWMWRVLALFLVIKAGITLERTVAALVEKSVGRGDCTIRASQHLGFLSLNALPQRARAKDLDIRALELLSRELSPQQPPLFADWHLLFVQLSALDPWGF